MSRRAIARGTPALALLLVLVGCATAPGPWEGHAGRADAKAARLDPAAVCPVILSNGTPGTVDASYEVVGMRFDLGLLPSGQSAEFQVQCQAGRVRATGVSHTGGLDEARDRYQVVARLDGARVTRLQLSQANKVH